MLYRGYWKGVPIHRLRELFVSFMHSSWKVSGYREEEFPSLFPSQDRYLVQAGYPGYNWEGAPTYRISCRLETKATSKKAAIAKWHEAFSEAEKASIKLETLEATNVDEELPSFIQYYKEGRVLYFDGNKKDNTIRRKL